MVRILQLECHDAGDPEAVAGLVAALPGLQAGDRDTVTRRCLDTPDGRLSRRGLVLEADAGAHGITLSLREVDGTREPAACRSGALPQRARDVRDPRLRRKLREAAGRRPLRPWLECRVRTRNYACLDAQHKTVASVVLEQCVDGPGQEPAPLLASLVPKRGYAREAKRFRQALEDCLSARRLEQDRAMVIARALGVPESASRKNPPNAIAPDTPPAVALSIALTACHTAMRANEAGLLTGTDPECLHDFRIAVRRSRSLITAFPEWFGDVPPSRFEADLGWYTERTSAMRDLDVLALEAANVADTGALPSFLETMRRRERTKVRRLLASQRHAAFCEDYVACLATLRRAVDSGKRPVTEVASRAIAFRHRRVLRRIRKSSASRTPEKLHRLRKDCKRLRYLLEAFASLYPPNRLARAVKDLKRLQDGLGRLCDTQARHAMLAQWRDAATRGELEPAVADGLGRIVATLDQRAAVEAPDTMLARFAAPATVARYEDLFRGSPS